MLLFVVSYLKLLFVSYGGCLMCVWFVVVVLLSLYNFGDLLIGVVVGCCCVLYCVVVCGCCCVVVLDYCLLFVVCW